ncbi:MAG: fasciclin domain-containing protein [Bacteroidaceae bacterium]|nr:fasciclin domain-containing protein [Bacteroidaceae bacterium]
MRPKNFRNTKSAAALLIAAVALPAIALTSCTEDIDDSNLYTFTGEMMTDHFRNEPETFSSYYTLISRVRTSSKSESTIAQLLEARGHYTCFAPTNEAIAFFIDSLYDTGELTTKDLNQIPDSIAETIVFNSIIDNQSSQAYASTDFSVGALSLTNMKDRYVSISFGNDSTGATIIYVNSNSEVIDKDIEVENGYIHTINKVLSPSTATVADLIQSTENLRYFGYLLGVTGWDANLTLYRDEDYELDERKDEEPKRSKANGGHWKGIFPEHRYFGYTVFAETDSVFQEKLGGFANEKEFLDKLMAFVKENAFYYDNTSYGTDYTNPDNAINQFVAYHLLPERLIWSRMVVFSNEKGYSNESPNDGSGYSVNVWDYYETMGYHRRSLKITGIRNGKRLNRHSIMNLSTYKEKEADIPGININPTNGGFDNNAMNGYYYTIDDILLWTDQVPKRVLNERMRYDVCALLPELMTNNCRRTGDSNHRGWYFLQDYFQAKNGGSGCIPYISNETDFCYLTNTQNAHSGGWLNYQADEFNISGSYDFTLKLPPVPYTGTYEIRYGMNNNNVRGMAQIYLGTNPNNLPAVGIPIDLRTGYSDNSKSIGWVKDSDLGNDDAIEENEKTLRNNEYLKGPKYFYPSPTASGRDFPLCLRRIIFRGQLEEGKTYFIRFKSVLKSANTEFFFDYLEFVPKTVYNGEEPEDKW